MRAVRFPENPIIRPEMLSGDDGANINGPSLIRTPDWLPRRLGKYYLYFAHHGGRYIRLAYADALAGPWHVYRPGTLRLDEAPCQRHVASPDVHVDGVRRRIRMYYHGCRYASDGKTVRQFTFVATSEDGIDFASRSDVLGGFYFRVFRWGGWYYCCRKGGQFLRSRDGLSPFEPGPTLLQPEEAGVTVRHTAVLVEGDRLKVFYSRIGDCPERILMSEVCLLDDWTRWRSSPPRTVLAPETDYEGAGMPHHPSAEGKVMGPAWQLRDPAVWREDGRTYLLYSVAGECGIAIAELLD